MKAWIRGRALLLACLVAISCDRQPTLSDNHATELLEEDWNNGQTCTPIGELQVVRTDVDFAKKRINLPIWEFIQELAGVGVVKASVEKDLTQRFSGWQNWFELTQNGVQKIVLVEVQPRAAEVGAVVTSEAEGFGGTPCLQYAPERYRIERIVKNQVVEHPIEQMHVVYGFHVAELAPLPKLLAEARGQGTEPSRRKFRALVKYDLFSEEWKVAVVDIARSDEDFRTSRVPDAVR